MPGKIRLWQRDEDIITETTRSPLSTGQIARLHRFPSPKKAAERLLPLYRAGLLKRVAYFHHAMQGKPAYVYYTGARPHPRTLSHTIAISEIRVQLAEWLRSAPGYTAQFFYANEIQTSSGLLPDATLLIHKAERTALVFVEIDNGTEPVTSSGGYSLAGKLRSYAAYFDAAAYQQDFSWAGMVRGFRVALVVPAGRLRPVQQLVTTESHDFVLLTTAERCRQGFHQAIWVNHDNITVDVLGRPGEFVGDVMGKQESLLPVATSTNSRTSNDVRAPHGERY